LVLSSSLKSTNAPETFHHREKADGFLVARMERLTYAKTVGLSRGEIARAMRIVFGGEIINEDRSRVACLHAYAWPRRHPASQQAVRYHSLAGMS
jgi:hypothetical protein